MLSFSICPTAFFMVRFRWGRDPTLQLYDDSFTELPDKSEFDAKNERELPRFAGSSLSDIIGVRWVSFRRSGRLPRCPYRDLQ